MRSDTLVCLNLLKRHFLLTCDTVRAAVCIVFARRVNFCCSRHRLHYEKLKAIREQLLHQTAAEGLLVDGRQANSDGLHKEDSEHGIAL